MSSLGSWVQVNFYFRINGRPSSSTDESPQAADKITLPCFSKQGISEKATRYYASGLSLREISKELGIAKSTVLKSLKQSGVSLRPSTHDHKNLKAREKNSLVGAPPYGFARLRGKLIVAPKEIETVRQIMDLWQQHMTFRTIAKHLNSLGLLTRKGSKWEHSVIKSIINRHKDNPNRIEEIITWASKN